MYALVDCNNFYVSCERVFNPALIGKPVMVLSNNDGCVIARSNEVKALGIKMGEPLFKCKSLVAQHDIHVFSSNFALYGDMSARVMNTLAQFAPAMEIYSVDEAFLSLHGMQASELDAFGRMLRNKVLQWTGIPVSVGIASTKTLTKVANELSKKNSEYGGVLNLSGHPRIDSLLEKIEVGDVWGVGYSYAKLLRSKGVNNARQLRELPDKWVKKNMTVTGLRMVHELRGTPCLLLQEQPPPKQAIVCSRSFGTPVTTVEALREAIATFISRAAEKMRKQNSAASYLQVFIMTSMHGSGPRYSKARGVTLGVATSYTPRLIAKAYELLDEIFAWGFVYKKAGVMLTGFMPDGQVQQALEDMGEGDSDKQRTIMHTVDRVNCRFGSGTVSYAAAGVQPKWGMRQTKKSPRYTTAWDDILKIKV